MYNIYKSAIVFHPENMQTLYDIMSKNPDFIIIAGATDVMRITEGQHPNQLSNTLISLDKIDKMFLLKKTAGYIEIGSMVPLVKICEFFSNYLPRPILSCINKTFSFSLQSVITLGGTVASTQTFYDISAPLICAGVLVDISKFTASGFKDFRITVEEYYQLSEEEKRKIVIRNFLVPIADQGIGYSERSWQMKNLDFYKTYSNSYFEKEKSVVLSASFVLRNDEIDDAHIAITYADLGTRNMLQTALAMCDNAAEYLAGRQIEVIRSTFEKELESFFNKNDRENAALLLFDSIIEDIQLEIL